VVQIFSSILLLLQKENELTFYAKLLQSRGLLAKLCRRGSDLEYKLAADYKKINLIKMGTDKNNARVFAMSFASVYPLYIQKAERKGRTKEEVDEIIFWLTGYNQKTLKQHIDKKTNFETFFTQAPQMNPNVSKITGVICGYRVEEIEDKLMQKIRYLDKLVDELAKGRTMEKILRK